MKKIYFTMSKIKQIIDWYLANPDAFNSLDYKTDYKLIANIIGATSLRKLIYNTPPKVTRYASIVPNPIKKYQPKPKNTKVNKTKVAKPIKVPDKSLIFKATEPVIVPDKISFKKYRTKVYILTRQQPLELLEDYDLWTMYKPKTKRSMRSPDCYCIDHKISIHFAWKRGIPEEVVSHIDNLRIITAFENSNKNTKNFIDDKNQWIWDEFIASCQS